MHHHLGRMCLTSFSMWHKQQSKKKSFKYIINLNSNLEARPNNKIEGCTEQLENISGVSLEAKHLSGSPRTYSS